MQELPLQSQVVVAGSFLVIDLSFLEYGDAVRLSLQLRRKGVRELTKVFAGARLPWNNCSLTYMLTQATIASRFVKGLCTLTVSEPALRQVKDQQRELAGTTWQC